MPAKNASGGGGLKRSASLYVGNKSTAAPNDENAPPSSKYGKVSAMGGIGTGISRDAEFKSPAAKKKGALEANSSLLNLSITDCTCPICLEILVEPVQMPCNHEVCLPCFKAMTDKTNFLCPMCRMRISTWSRMNSNTLVNQKRWQQIQRAFPKEISDRVEGKTAALLAESMRREKEEATNGGASSGGGSDHHHHHHHNQQQHLVEPGAIRKEYEEYLRREQERIRIEKENEEKLSLQYIQQVIVSKK